MASTTSQWHRCKIDRKLLKELSQRNDLTPALWFGSYLLLVAGLAAMTVWTWGTPQAWIWAILHGLSWGAISSATHELSHGTPFKTRWMNEAVYWLMGWMGQFEPVSNRWAHAGHHNFTHYDGKDTELSEPNPVTWRNFFNVGFGLWAAAYYWRFLIGQSFGIFPRDIKKQIPEKELPLAIWNARIMVLIYAGFIAWAILAQTWLPIVLVVAPRWISGPITGFLHLTQHTCLKMNVPDHRFSTRSFKASPITRFFYFNMNHHIEHHMFPMVPFYNLPKLSAAISDQLPEPCNGLYGVFSEIITGIRRQHREPGYFIEKAVPGAAVREAA